MPDPTYLDVLQALNALPNGGAPILPPITPTPALPLIAAPSPPASLPSFAPPPSPAPVAPMPALDPRIVAAYQAIRGPAPSPPAPLSTRQRIGNALLAFGAGFQGRGPEVLAQIRQPQREYEQNLQRYNEQGTQLGVMGLNAAREQAQTQQAQTQRQADEQARRDFDVFLQRQGVQDQEARDRLLHQFDLEKVRETERIADEKLTQQEQQQLKLKAADLASKYRLAGAIDPTGKEDWANELAKKDLGLSDKVSQGATKWLSAHVKLEQARANKLARTGAGAGTGGVSAKAQKALAAFNAAHDAVVERVRAGDFAGEQVARQRMKAALNVVAKFPNEIEYGSDPSGLWPYAKLKGAQATAPVGATQPAATGTGFVYSRAEVEKHARDNNLDPAAVEADLKARGFIVQ